jgi:hypothetical protein
MDIARYADTKGYVFNEDANYHWAYTYRDYLIRAFNSDEPYDRMVREQLAADKLGLDPDHRGALAAMGFLTLGRRHLNNTEDIIADRIDVTSRGFMALTVACARCHDHKYDPIPTQDYYSFYGFFDSSQEPGPQSISIRAIAEPYEKHAAMVRDKQQAIEATIRAQVEALRKRQAELPKPVMEAIQRTGEGAIPGESDLKTIEPQMAAAALARLTQLRAEKAELDRKRPPEPEMALTLQDSPTPHNVRIFKRGNSGNQGDEAPRRFLRILAGENPPPMTEGSGRLQLANAIASPANPLTGRVLANRLWQAMFSDGIVRTPSDFGLRGELPSHPELLDWLAATFVSSGDGLGASPEAPADPRLAKPWGIKKVLRLIALSSVYRESSGLQPKMATVDPENRLLWRHSRRRLSLEEMRDSLLVAAGDLDGAVGGQSVEITRPPWSRRRTLYGFIDRLNLQDFYRNFNLPTPDVNAGKRHDTTVPQQALFVMNSPFVVERARALASKVAESDDAKRVRRLYLRALGRVPTAAEEALALEFVRQAPGNTNAPPDPRRAWSYGYGAVDERNRAVTGFTPLPYFGGRGWQGGEQFPDSKLSFLILTATGGHVGIDQQHAAIRRWTAPAAMVVSIDGVVKHEADARGDGVRARIVASGQGVLGTWSVHMSEAPTKLPRVAVKQGDTIDFVVDCQTAHDYDSFTWAPVIRRLSQEVQQVAARDRADLPKVWDAHGDFSGPLDVQQSLTPWDELAQVLLMTNEFHFLD